MRFALAAAVALAATPLVAQMPTTPPGKPDVTLAKAGSYTLDSDHAQVLFTVNHLGFSEYTGQFTQPHGTLTLDPKNAANDKVEVTFPIGKVSTTTPKLDAHLQTPDFFDAAKFPEAKFVSTRIVTSGKTATITGNLTLKGVTKPVVLTARFIGTGDNFMSKKTNIGFAATATIKRSDFGMTFLLPLVSDEVTLTINASFIAG